MERVQTVTAECDGQRQFKSLHGFSGTARIIGKCVEDSLVEELVAYPKPGMVSCVDSGSHTDMDALTFRKSIAAIAPYFTRLAAAGYDEAPLGELRSIGIDAEKAMFAATGGINTHRGTIFILGLLAAAAGAASKQPWDLHAPGRIVSEKWGRDLLQPEEFTGPSHGTAAYHKHGITGARGEAASGFKNIYDTGLPAYSLAMETEPDAAAVHCFFALMENVGDTNLLHRGGPGGLKFAMDYAATFNRDGGVFNKNWKSSAIEIHREFIRRNLSAGGVADLLSATIFLYKLDKEMGATEPENWLNERE